MAMTPKRLAEIKSYCDLPHDKTMLQECTSEVIRLQKLIDNAIGLLLLDSLQGYDQAVQVLRRA